MKYQPVLDLITPFEDERRRITDARDSLIGLINSTFLDDPSFVKLKVIGSAATGNYLRGYRDLDALIVFNTFDRQNFRSRLIAMHGFDIENFNESPRLVLDKVNGIYKHFSVSLGVTIDSRVREEHLDADMLYHPDFTLEHILDNQRSDILLLKQLLKNKGMYGTKINGFAVEQIIAKYKGFSEFLEALMQNEELFVDFSGKYDGPKDPLVVSYPYSGKGNLVHDFTEKDLQTLREYAQLVTRDLLLFVTDTRKTFNIDFWKKRVRKYGAKEEFGMPDVYLNRRENRVLRRSLNALPGEKVLDAGCANGYTPLNLFSKGGVLVWGVDVNKDSILIARKLAEERGHTDIHFVEGDLTGLDFIDNFFDKTYAKRSISNLSSREEQLTAIRELTRITRKSGRIFLFDLFVEGYQRLNELREKVGLEKIIPPSHCLPLDEPFIKTVTDNTSLRTIKMEDPTSGYYLTTRVYIPRLLKLFNRQPRSNSVLNRMVSWIPSFGNLGVDRLYIFEKNDN